MKARFLRARQTGQTILPRAKQAILTILSRAKRAIQTVLSKAKRVVLPAILTILSGAKRVILPAILTILSGAKRVILAAILAVLLLGASARAEDLPSVPRKDLWVTNGPVDNIVRDGNTIYIGGRFTHVGPRTGCGVPIDTVSGNPVASYPEVNGYVYACAADGSGGWYIGGPFTYVGGVARNYIAHILSDGSVDPAWNPDANSYVQTLAVSGSTVYAGGLFTSIGGQSRNCIAALDAATGQATAWNPDANSYVQTLAVSGSTVYAGGLFTSIGGQARNRIVALDVATGLATAWNPDANSQVEALVVSGSTVYAGGEFNSIGGQARNYIAALDATTGQATAWNPDGSGGICALVVSGSTVYAAGEFTSIGGLARNSIAALDVATGAATAWNAGLTTASLQVLALAVSGSTVYAGGYFTLIGGQTRNNIAALDATSGAATTWNPDANLRVYALAVSGSTVYAGGDFTSVGGQMRNRIAALDAITGAATAWNPDANGWVFALAVSGTTVYAGGFFTSVGGQGRNRIVALDATTGAATAWNPDANNTVWGLTISGSTVYAAGNFTSIGGQARNRLAALDATTGAATAWNPDANQDAAALAVFGSTVYAWGDFPSIGGQARPYIVALDATTGAATSWNPNANGWVHALAVSGSTFYVGGYFTSIGGQARNYIAALDMTTGLSTDWNPNTNGIVRSLSLSGSTVYAGGDFTSIGGQTRNFIAAIDATTGQATAWNPGANNQVSALAVSGSAVYAGGAFTSIGPLAQSGIAQFSVAPRIESVIYNDLDDDGTVEAGETLTLVMNRPVTINPPQLTQSDFYLCVSGDSLGGAGFSAALSPENARHIVLTLGANPVLKLAGDADPGVTAPGSSSGLDFSTTLAVGDVRSAEDGMPAEAGGQPGVNDSAVDILFTCVTKTTAIPAASGGTATVTNSPDAAYTHHALAIPAGALSQNASITMRPPQVNLGVLNAVQIDLTAAGGGAGGQRSAGIPPVMSQTAFPETFLPRNTRNTRKASSSVSFVSSVVKSLKQIGPSSDPAFSQPVTLTLQYKDSDYDTAAGDVEASMRIHQLVLNASSAYEWMPLSAARQNQSFDNTVSVQLDTLNPCGDTGLIRVFAVLPGWTIEPIKAHVRPDLGGGGGSAVIQPRPAPSGGGAALVPGANGDYRLHRIEIPNYTVTTETDPDRITIEITPPTLLHRLSPSGTSFPASSSALFVVTARNAADDPVAFTSPVNLRVQFMDGTWNAYSDLVSFQGLNGPAASMRVARDQCAGPGVDFALAGGVGQTVDLTSRTVEALGVTNLTDSSGEGLWGAVIDPSLAPAVPPPPAPTSPRVIAAGLDTIQWAWQDNSTTETAFRIYCGPGTAAPTVSCFTTAADAAQWTATGLTPGTQYAFQVSAYSVEGGESPKTATITAWTLAAPPTPSEAAAQDRWVLYD